MKPEFTSETIEDLMVSAMEGGSNYWYLIEDTKPIKTATPEMKDEPLVCRLIKAVERGVKVTILDIEDEKVLGVLDKNSFVKGTELMFEKYPYHYADAVTENGDAITGDVFFQLALMGELIYG